MGHDEKACQPIEGSGLSRRRFLGLTVAGGAVVAAAAAGLEKVVAQETAGGKKAQYALVIDTTKCVGCGLCIQACHQRNKLPEGQSWTWVPEKQTGERTWFHPMQCQHCAKPPCAAVCPTKATYIHESGVVLVNEKLCVGCKYCMVACPYQARVYDEERGIADKCWLCLDWVLQGELPACAQACLYGARVFGRTDDPDSEVSKILASGRAKPLRPEFKTQPAVLTYIIEG
jgi:Fe-S-cluster-containing dehydrogenase component